MEDDRKRYDPMDMEPTKSPSLAATAYGSPSYSPPELEEGTDHKGKLKDYDTTAEEDDRKTREARRKAKGKGKATLPGEDSDDEEERKAREARRNAKGKGKAPLSGEDFDDEEESVERPYESRLNTTPEPLASHPTAAEDTDMDMEEYWADYGMRFGDTDAAMNDAIFSPSSPAPPSSPSYNYEADNENDPPATSAVRQPLAERRGLANPGDLVTLQQQQVGSGWGRGRGRGRGSGTGWGLEWKETVTDKMVTEQGWRHDDYPISSVEEDAQWEVYDEAAWDRAAEKSKELEAGKVTLKIPSLTRAEGSNMRATASKRVTVRELMRQGWEFVQAVTDYKAILRGTYLSYEKGDVMKVIHRDSDGELFDLLPLKDPANSGRAHTKNFVRLDDTDEKVHGNEAGGGGVERKGA